METKKENNNTPWFAKITVCLYIIIAFLALNSILLIVSLGDTKTEKTNNTQTASSYDTSNFAVLTTDQIMESIKASDMQVIFMGRDGCGWCAQFAPVMEQVQAKFGFITTYLDLDDMSSSDQQKIMELDDYVKENFGSTPLLILAKDGKYVAASVGYMDADGVSSFLKEHGMTEK